MWILLLLVSTAQAQFGNFSYWGKKPGMRYYGSAYAGTGIDGYAISGVPFKPDLVIIKAATANTGVLRTSTMTGDSSKDTAAYTALEANLIQSLDSSGFSVGTDARVNTNGTTYYYMAFKNYDGEMEQGTYTGNGVDNRNISATTFQPDYLIIIPPGANQVVFRNSAWGAGDLTNAYEGGPNFSGAIKALAGTGFQVGTANTVNTNGSTYRWIAWKAIPKRIVVGSYVGNGVDDRNITGLGMQPEYLKINRDGGSGASHKSSFTGANTSMSYLALGNRVNEIQDLLIDGFQVGTANPVNANTSNYYYIAFRDSPN